MLFLWPNALFCGGNPFFWKLCDFSNLKISNADENMRFSIKFPTRNWPIWEWLSKHFILLSRMPDYWYLWLFAASTTAKCLLKEGKGLQVNWACNVTYWPNLSGSICLLKALYPWPESLIVYIYAISQRLLCTNAYTKKMRLCELDLSCILSAWRWQIELCISKNLIFMIRIFYCVSMQCFRAFGAFERSWIWQFMYPNMFDLMYNGWVEALTAIKVSKKGIYYSWMG